MRSDEDVAPETKDVRSKTSHAQEIRRDQLGKTAANPCPAHHTHFFAGHHELRFLPGSLIGGTSCTYPFKVAPGLDSRARQLFLMNRRVRNELGAG